MRSYSPIADMVTAASTSTSRGRLVGTEGAVNSDPLLTVNMPHLHFWMLQVSPVVAGQGASIELQYSVRPRVVGRTANATSDEWLALSTTAIILDPSGLTPTRIYIPFPASKIRIRATGFASGAFTLDYVLACAAS